MGNLFDGLHSRLHAMVLARRPDCYVGHDHHVFWFLLQLWCWQAHDNLHQTHYCWRTFRVGITCCRCHFLRVHGPNQGIQKGRIYWKVYIHCLWNWWVHWKSRLSHTRMDYLNKQATTSESNDETNVDLDCCRLWFSCIFLTKISKKKWLLIW